MAHPVFAACEQGDLAVVRAYLDQGGSVYGCENLGVNPAAPRGLRLGRSLAMRAVQANQGDVLKLLLARGLDVNRPPMIFDIHLLDLAWQEGHPEMVNLLIDSGASFQFSSPRRPSFFWTACKKGTDVPVVEKMIRLGAAVDESHYDGSTPLMYAMETHDAELIMQLLARGANLNAKDNQNRTALTLARDFHGGEVWHLVRNSMPDGDKNRSL